MTYGDVKISRILIESNVMGVNEMTDLDAVVLFGMRDGKIVMGALGEFTVAQMIEISANLGMLLGAGFGAHDEMAAVAAKVAARALTMGAADKEMVDNISAQCVANELAFKVES